MASPPRSQWIKYLLATAIPVLIALLQSTVGEASLPVYLTMAIPAPFWAVLPLSVMTYAAIKKRWVWAFLNLAVFLIIILLQAGYCFGNSRIPAGPTLRVMTFNVQIFNNHSIEEVASAIRKENPDVVCLQEMPTTGKDHKFAALLKEYDFVIAGRLAVATRLPATQGTQIQLRGDARRALIVELRFQGKPIRIINVHLQHFPSDNLSKAGDASTNLMKEIAGLERVVSAAAVPTIVAGDLNSIPQGRVNRMLRSHLSDCFAATSRGYGFTLPATLPVRRVDYIYAGFGFVPSRSEVSDAVASDHRAVVARIALAQ